MPFDADFADAADDMLLMFSPPPRTPLLSMPLIALRLLRHACRR